MRSLFLLLVAFLSAPLPASAQEQASNDQWEWIKTEHGADGWSVSKGLASVEIADGKIRARLQYQDGIYVLRYDISGTIEFGRVGEEFAGIQPGKVTVTVTQDATDITPSKFVGTYRKAIYPDLARRSFGVLFVEFIVLGDSVSTLSFYRATKDPASAK